MVIVVAMMSEAMPIVDALGMTTQGRLHSCYPMEHYFSDRHPNVHLVINGRCPRFGVDNIASQPATVAAFLSIEKLKPCILLNAGTAGGFSSAGSSVGDVYLGYPSVYFHDRRIPIPRFREFGLGGYVCPDVRPMAAALGMKTGVVSTGNSLASISTDLEIMQSYEGRAKDMEAAAIAWVAEQHRVPFIAIKAITDLVDTEKPVHEAFLENLATASSRLALKTVEVIDYLETHGIPAMEGSTQEGYITA
ncbi:MAG: 5'-methylthioadenosine/S-adenosylhomocysteine nucleosidase [Verrucomicrobia bacterium ADurb.Bin474]|nr:MAG: 5'-methylthioadenosine/S-adenosylhomocysteine nucleosidase [Verrucomicrobia bacterium ADurb.Bin474]